MAYENLQDYTEIDAQGTLSLTYTRITGTEFRGDSGFSYVYKDFGEDYFDDDIRVGFKAWHEGDGPYASSSYVACFGSYFGDIYDIKDNRDILALRFTSNGGAAVMFYIYEYYDGSSAVSSTSYQGTLLDHWVWVRFVLDKDAGTYGTAYAYFYETKAAYDADTPDDTISLALHKSVSYRYFMPVSSYVDGVGDEDWWMSFMLENFDFGTASEACPMPAMTTMTPYCPVEVHTMFKGRADGTTANKLIDSNALFSTWGVAPGMRVDNRTDGTFTQVTAVDSETTLSVQNDYFVSGEFYTISSLYLDMTNDVIEINDWDEYPFSAQATVKVNNADDTYNSVDTRNKFLKINRGYVYGGDNYQFTNAQWFKIVDDGWASWNTFPQDTYVMKGKGLWEILNAYKIPEDFHFNSDEYAMTNFTEILDMTAKQMINFVLLLAGLSLGSDIEDVSAEYVGTLKPQLSFSAGTSGAYIVISILSMFGANLLCRQDKMHFIIDSNTKSYEYRCPHDASYISFKGGNETRGLPKFLKAEVWSDADQTYSGSYASTDPAWTPDMGVIRYIDPTGVCTSDAICAAMAQAIVEREALNIATGSVYLEIMDVCQEIYTNNTIVDGRANITQTGLTGGLKFRYIKHRTGGVYDCWITCGGLGRMVGDNLEQYLNTLALGVGGGIPSDAIIDFDTIIETDALKWSLLSNGFIALDSGDKIQGDTTTAATVDYTINGVVEGAAKQIAAGQLPNAKGDLYTASNDGEAITSITVVNWNSTDESVNLYLLPSGGTARRIFPEDLTVVAYRGIVFNGTSFKAITGWGGLKIGR